MEPVNNLKVNNKATRFNCFNLRKIETRVKCGILSAAMLASLGVEANAVESTTSTQETQQTQTLSLLDELIAKTMIKSNRESFNNLEIKTGIPIYVNDELSAPVVFNGVVGVPFILDGVTYLPVRDICKMFNVNIKWISDYESVLIDTTSLSTTATNPNKVTTLPTTINKEVTGTKNVNVYVYNGKTLIKLNITQMGYKELAKTFVINGTTYLPVRTLADLFGISITYDSGVRIGTHVKTIAPTEVDYDTVDLSVAVSDMQKYYNLLLPYGEILNKGTKNCNDVLNYMLYREQNINIDKTNSQVVSYLNQYYSIYDELYKLQGEIRIAYVKRDEYLMTSLSQGYYNNTLDKNDTATIRGLVKEYKKAYENINTILIYASDQYINNYKSQMDSLLDKINYLSKSKQLVK